MDVEIVADRVTLDVPLFVQRERVVRGWAGMLLGAAFDTPSREVVRLLEDVSFRFSPGDRVALLGRNGAGKSTLLRLLNNVYRPTSGSLHRAGSCQALLNISLGFTPDATVRENIILRGVAMGLRASYLKAQSNAILDFAGLEEKANHRLRTLSSGQKVRLGFAISTSVQTDIMLMDEWVGTGDVDFMRRAKERMQDRLGGSKIVVLASHSLGLVREVCNRGVVIERGRVTYDGEIGRALKHYQRAMAAPSEDGVGQAAVHDGVAGNVSGLVDEVRLAEGVLEISGWALSDDSRPVEALVAEFLGDRILVERFERIARPDVQEFFGLLDPGCGYRIQLEVGTSAAERDVLATLVIKSTDGQSLRHGRKVRARAQDLGIPAGGGASPRLEEGS
ncbi:ABC transporter ATP-binding protein [Alkalisalibacterium limincola]|uniref:ABC transporter ATP-binding protein n=1 Tax=Alkalisalibacterium limincola TaxID=2699169 RepID=A0A5C8KHB7_9GAMM|nr:ATP-binding cassette domain-containing protein [Alkalisalibacterium limincola]TXK59850.1 ABC transporter ATP-binding protein [Alkalisalibacterium limincola]